MATDTDVFDSRTGTTRIDTATAWFHVNACLQVSVSESFDHHHQSG